MPPRRQVPSHAVDEAPRSKNLVGAQMGSGSDSRTGTAAVQSRLSQAVQEMDDAFFLADRDGCFTYVNDALVTLTGLPVETVCGKCFTEIFAGDDQKTAVAALATVVAGKKIRAELGLIRGPIRPRALDAAARVRACQVRWRRSNQVSRSKRPASSFCCGRFRRRCGSSEGSGMLSGRPSVAWP